MRKPPTGEPCAGEPHERFGGRGGETLPDPYHSQTHRKMMSILKGLGLGAPSWPLRPYTEMSPRPVRDRAEPYDFDEYAVGRRMMLDNFATSVPSFSDSAQTFCQW